MGSNLELFRGLGRTPGAPGRDISESRKPGLGGRQITILSSSELLENKRDYQKTSGLEGLQVDGRAGRCKAWATSRHVPDSNWLGVMARRLIVPSWMALDCKSWAACSRREVRRLSGSRTAVGRPAGRNAVMSFRRGGEDGCAS